MPKIISQPDVAKWYIGIICSDVFRASQTERDGCLSNVLLFARDLRHAYFGSGMDNAGDYYYYVACPNCEKILLLHDREVPSYVQAAFVKKVVPPPDPDLATFFTGWQMELTCGGNSQHRKNGCGQKLTAKSGDVSYGDFSRFDDHHYRHFVACSFCGHQNKLRSSGLPKFVRREAELKYEIGLKSLKSR